MTILTHYVEDISPDGDRAGSNALDRHQKTSRQCVMARQTTGPLSPT